MFTGKPAPDFTLPEVSGGEVSLKDIDTDLVAVVFSCNHCPYVKAYENRLKKIQDEYRENLTVVAVNANDDTNYPDDSFEKMKENAQKKGFNFIYARDDGAATARAFEAKITPEVYLLDKDRKIRYHGRIDDSWQSEMGVKRHDLREAIEDLLHNREVAVKNTAPIGCTIKWPAP